MLKRLLPAILSVIATRRSNLGITGLRNESLDGQGATLETVEDLRTQLDSPSLRSIYPCLSLSLSGAAGTRCHNTVTRERRTHVDAHNIRRLLGRLSRRVSLSRSLSPRTSLSLWTHIGTLYLTLSPAPRRRHTSESEWVPRSRLVHETLSSDPAPSTIHNHHASGVPTILRQFEPSVIAPPAASHPPSYSESSS